MTGPEPRAERLASRESPLIPMQGGELRQPKRAMGFLDLVLFYVVTGISLRWIATAASAGPSAVVIWVGAWLAFYTPLALSVIELSSRYPQEGGLYIWSKRAFGDFAGFLCSWIYSTSNLPYFPAVLYFAFSNALYMRGQRSAQFSNDARFFILFSLIALTVITLLNVIGIDIGKWLHNAGALAMWLPVMVVIVLGMVAWRRFGSATSFTTMTMTPSTHFKDIIFWSSLTFAFGGCETASFMGGEIKKARPAIPLALLTAGMVGTFCYVMGTVGVLLALPHNQVIDLEGLMPAITQTAARLRFFLTIPLAAALIAISNLGAAGAYLAALSRLPFVAGIQSLLPPFFCELATRLVTPPFCRLLR